MMGSGWVISLLMCSLMGCLAERDVIHYPMETKLSNVRQLTYGGANAEAYFSFDNRYITFQSSGIYGTECDQIYRIDVANNMDVHRVSTGLGVTTCSYFFPNGNEMLYASTHRTGSQECPKKLCSNDTMKNQTIQELCDHGYTWDIYPDYDIYKTNMLGNIKMALTDGAGYDAEATVAKSGNRIVFTSLRSGDPEIYTMNATGGDIRQLTNELGYDGGAFFSHDEKKIVFRASRPNTDEEKDLYTKMLKFNLVNPLAMELFVVNADGEPMPRQITHLGKANWAPNYYTDNEHIIFSSNHKAPNNSFNFQLYLINENDESKLEQITFDPIFDAFPMFSSDGKQLVWISNRNGTHQYEFNIFIADFHLMGMGEGSTPTPTDGTSTPTDGTSTPALCRMLLALLPLMFAIALYR